MFVTLLVVTFLIAIATSAAVIWLFRTPVRSILDRILSPGLSSAWVRYVNFAVLVVGVSGGVRIWELERYITAPKGDAQPLVLNGNRWVLEVYRTLIGTLQSTAWLLLVFFVVALLAYVVMRGFELKKGTDATRT